MSKPKRTVQIIDGKEVYCRVVTEKEYERLAHAERRRDFLQADRRNIRKEVRRLEARNKILESRSKSYFALRNYYSGRIEKYVNIIKLILEKLEK